MESSVVKIDPDAAAPAALPFSAVRGTAALIIAMGIGRFAFTPLLPPMQAEAQFSDAAAGFLASINLLGYFAGALAAGALRQPQRERVYRIALLVAVLADIFMAAPLGLPGWAIARLAAGISSGLIFVLATAFVLEQRGHAGLHFAGVGLGIVVSGLVAEFVAAWQAAWLVLAGLSIPLGLLAMTLKGAEHAPGHPPVRQRFAWSLPFAWLVVAYSLEGVGYIVNGTFLVAILRNLPQTANLGAWAWVLVGCAAAPGVLIWTRIAKHLGSWRALALAYAAQVASIVLPFAGGAATTLAAAIMFGGTFVGITAVSLTLAGRLRPAQAGQAVALCTIFYSIGQALGPLLAGLAAQIANGFALPLFAAAACVAVAGLITVIGERAAAHAG